MKKTSSSRVKTTVKLCVPPPPLLSMTQTFSVPLFVGVKGALDGGSRFHMSILRNRNVALSNLRNAPVTLSILTNVHVACHYLFNGHVACH